jgi:hypothetical protein
MEELKSELEGTYADVRSFVRTRCFLFERKRGKPTLFSNVNSALGRTV